jgi:hypothetical protein
VSSSRAPRAHAERQQHKRRGEERARPRTHSCLVAPSVVAHKRERHSSRRASARGRGRADTVSSPPTLDFRPQETTLAQPPRLLQSTRH